MTKHTKIAACVPFTIVRVHMTTELKNVSVELLKHINISVCGVVCGEVTFSANERPGHHQVNSGHWIRGTSHRLCANAPACCHCYYSTPSVQHGNRSPSYYLPRDNGRPVQTGVLAMEGVTGWRSVPVLLLFGFSGIYWYLLSTSDVRSWRLVVYFLCQWKNL